MAARHLTDSLVRKLSAPTKGMSLTFDDELSGFACRVTANGKRAFTLNYRINGRQRSITLGPTNVLSVTQARMRAAELKRQVLDGRDPLQEKLTALHAPTINDLVRHYEENVMPRKRPNSQIADKAYLKNWIVPGLGTRKVDSIEHNDIASLHRKIPKPVLANRVIALCSVLFTVAIRQRWRTDNPCKHIEKNEEHPRHRYLSPDEIARLMAALDNHKIPSANAIRLLLLTGARKSEVLSATWDQFDLVQGVWSKPATSTKQRRMHRVPLSSAALDILHTMRDAEDQRIAKAKARGRIVRPEQFLFPGYRPGQSLKAVRDLWKSVCAEAQIEGVRVHDLRHSFASELVNAGQSLPIIGALLGHSSVATTARYSHLADEALRKAAEAVGVSVTQAKSARPRVVVPIRRA